jgi:pimeloyl-ACP methyl ester carboxylesterase
MKEQAFTFGQGENMVGVLTQPDVPTKAPPLIVFNAGFIHHVGPGRLSVDIARRAAQVGVTTFRFDLSGLGDSAPRVPAADPITDGLADARAAMDHLSATLGAEKFIVFGLCSGARYVYHVAVAEPRVAGAVMLDGYAYPTVRSRTLEVRERLQEPRALLAGAVRRAQRLLSGEPAPKKRRSAFDREGFFPEDVSPERMAMGLRTLVDRGVELLNVYSGEWREYRYEGQLQDAFPDVPLAGKLTERLIEAADHIYFTPPERAAMLDILASWLRQRFV